MCYFSPPLQARFRQPEWDHFSYSASRKSLRSPTTRARLLEQFRRWKGVRYRWGGTDAAGIDCSALTQEIYSAALNRRLPRTTEEQIREDLPVSVDQLRPGDLIFFKPKKTTRHVGIYVGHHRFMHASSSRGVTLSSLDNPFWTSHFETARRVAG